VDAVDAGAIAPHVFRGPLFDRQRALGATFYEDYGRLWTASFGDPVAEYRAAREGCVIWDVSALSKWHLTGPETIAAFDRLTTRATAGDPWGQVRYVLLLNEDGRLVEEGTRYLLGPEEGWLIGNEDRVPMTDHIVGAVADLHVRIVDRTDEIASLAVQGPSSCDLLAPLVDADLPSLGYYRAIGRTTVCGAEAMISRTGFSGELGYELFVFDGPEAARGIWDAITASGAVPIGLDAVEMLRIEAGFVIADEDYVSGRTDPVELGLDAFIDLDPELGFIGRDAIEPRMASPARRFVTLSLSGLGPGDPVPAPPQPVVHGGDQVGEIRSIERTPSFGVVALAVVAPASAVDGTAVQVGIDAIPATVRPRPIDAGDRARRARPQGPRL
jgi:aminomethyltransferase